MSKKIWRGFSEGNVSKIVTQDPPYDAWKNCAVVPDAACFPIKKAMALCKAVIDDQWGEPDSTDKLHRAIDRYLAAVERMKKKAGKP